MSKVCWRPWGPFVACILGHEAAKMGPWWERIPLKSFFRITPNPHTSFFFTLWCVTPRSDAFSHDGPYFSSCTRTSSSQWHCHNFFLSHRFLFHPTQRNTFLKSHRGKEPASFKLSTKSKLYVHDMSEAMFTALSVCLASAKLIVVVVSFSSFTPFPLSREKLSVLPALKRKREA